MSVITPILNFLPFAAGINTVLVTANTYVSAAFIASLNFINEHLNFALINLSNEVFVYVVLMTLTAMIVSSLQMKNKNIRRIFVVSVSIFTFICYNLLNYNVVTVTAFDSGREASFHISSKGKEYLVLSEWMTESDASQQIDSAINKPFEAIYYCPKEFKNYTDYSEICKQFIEVDYSDEYKNELFVLQSSISGNNKLFTIMVGDCSIQFGHGKISSDNVQYYFLGNDKPKTVTADEIYIYGNIPSWMEVENIIQISDDLKIKINLKTGNCKTVKDVFNFGYQL